VVKRRCFFLFYYFLVLGLLSFSFCFFLFSCKSHSFQRKREAASLCGVTHTSQDSECWFVRYFLNLKRNLYLFLIYTYFCEMRMVVFFLNYFFVYGIPFFVIFKLSRSWRNYINRKKCIFWFFNNRRDFLELTNQLLIRRR
jgi:hypothetical protein